MSNGGRGICRWIPRASWSPGVRAQSRADLLNSIKGPSKPVEPDPGSPVIFQLFRICIRGEIIRCERGYPGAAGKFSRHRRDFELLIGRQIRELRSIRARLASLVPRKVRIARDCHQFRVKPRREVLRFHWPPRVDFSQIIPRIFAPRAAYLSLHIFRQIVDPVAGISTDLSLRHCAPMPPSRIYVKHTGFGCHRGYLSNSIVRKPRFPIAVNVTK